MSSQPPERSHEGIPVADLAAIRANLVSINAILMEIIIAMRVGDKPDLDWQEMAHRVLRDHTWALGYEFRGERPSESTEG